MAAVSGNKKQQFLDNFIAKDVDEHSSQAKQDAVLALEHLDFPTTKDEYWKYTRVGKITNSNYSQSPTFSLTDVSKFKISGLNAHHLVFINGFYSEELSDNTNQNGIEVLPLAKARQLNHEKLTVNYGVLAHHKSQFFSALNTAFNTNGVFISIEKGVELATPIHIINLTDAENAAYNPRNLIVVGANAKANIISTFQTENGSSFANSVTEIFVESGAKLTTYIIQNESEKSKQVNEIDVVQAKNSTYSATTFTFTGGLVRNNHNVLVKGQGCETNLFGLYLGSNDQHIDNHTVIDHIEPNCNSNELYKGVLTGKSTGVFNGKVFVRQEAQKTNAFQQNQNMLMSDDASAYSKPELEIYADDVKCSHGSTTGQLDEIALFYLQSRGISRDNAMKMMIKAFAHEVIETVEIEPLKLLLEEKIAKRFA